MQIADRLRGRARSGLVMALLAAASARAEQCQRCGWSPPPTPATLAASTIGELRTALGRVQPGTTILLEDGEYPLDGVSLEVRVPRVVIRARSGNRSRAVIRGPGMDSR